MKILILLVLIGCAHQKTEQKDDLVSIDAALNQAQASYLKGCVDGLKELNLSDVFPGCRDKSVKHRKELDNFMSSQ